MKNKKKIVTPGFLVFICTITLWLIGAYAMAQEQQLSGSQLKPDAVSSANIADESISSDKITNYTIVSEDITSDAVTSSKILDGTILSTDLSAGAVSVAKLDATTSPNEGDCLKFSMGIFSWQACGGGGGGVTSVNGDVGPAVVLDSFTGDVAITGGNLNFDEGSNILWSTITGIQGLETDLIFTVGSNSVLTMQDDGDFVKNGGDSYKFIISSATAAEITPDDFKLHYDSKLRFLQNGGSNAGFIDGDENRMFFAAGSSNITMLDLRETDQQINFDVDGAGNDYEIQSTGHIWSVGGSQKATLDSGVFSVKTLSTQLPVTGSLEWGIDGLAYINGDDNLMEFYLNGTYVTKFTDTGIDIGLGLPITWGANSKIQVTDSLFTATVNNLVPLSASSTQVSVSNLKITSAASVTGTPLAIDANGNVGFGSGGGGNPFDQDLNTTDDVVFNSIMTNSLSGTTTGANDIVTLVNTGVGEGDLISGSTNSGDIIDVLTPAGGAGSYFKVDAQGDFYKNTGDNFEFVIDNVTTGVLSRTGGNPRFELVGNIGNESKLQLGDGGTVEFHPNEYISADSSSGLMQFIAGQDFILALDGNNNTIFIPQDYTIDLSNNSGSSTLKYDSTNGQTLINTNGGVTELYINDDGVDVQAANFALTNITDSTGTALVWDAGEVKTLTSSRRFKENIVDAPDLGGTVYDLRPVFYNRKSKPDKTEFGLIAEEVFEVLPELVVLDKEGQPFSIDYSRLSLVLIQEIKKLREEIELLKNQ